jgi:hypothetical protein
MAEGGFLHSLELSRLIEELENELADYRRVFEAVRQLFGRELVEVEGLSSTKCNHVGIFPLNRLYFFFNNRRRLAPLLSLLLPSPTLW